VVILLGWLITLSEYFDDYIIPLTGYTRLLILPLSGAKSICSCPACIYKSIKLLYSFQSIVVVIERLVTHSLVNLSCKK